MAQMRQAVATLRLTLADIQAREEQLDSMIRQFEGQLARLPRQAMYGRAPLDTALNAMAEIEERLGHAQITSRHLLSIKQRAQDELEALEVVQRVEEARASLAELKAQISAGGDADQETEEQIRRLEEYIAQYSRQAERAIITTGRGDEAP